MKHYNEELWWDSDSYCISVGLAAKLMTESGKFMFLNPESTIKKTNLDDVVLTFSKWLKERKE